MFRKVWLSALLVAGAPTLALAVDDVFCQVAENCTDDGLRIQFENGTADLANVNVGDTIAIKVFIDVKSRFTTGCAQPDPALQLPPITECSNVQGFSYGVKHDRAILELLTATHKGAAPIITLPDNPDPPFGGAAFKACRPQSDGAGFVQAVVMTFDAAPPLDLPMGDNLHVANASYKVKAAPAAAGTRIEFTNDLGIPDPTSPRTPTKITVGGKSKEPKTVRNAIVKGVTVDACAAPDYAFFFGPAATGGEFNTAGAGSVKVSMRNKGVALGFSLGIKKTGANLTFESTLGVSGREVELVITKADATEVSGPVLKGNSAGGAVANWNITRIDRGAALAGNTPGDFFGVDLAPAVGGPGATVGYAADIAGNGKTIPAVAADPAAGGCSVNNEILALTLAPGIVDKFARGDANGDSKINVTDGVVIAQNIFATRLVFFDCKDMLDANDDGALNTADPIFLLTYIFLNGPTPAAPFKACAADPSADALLCAVPNCT